MKPPKKKSKTNEQSTPAISRSKSTRRSGNHQGPKKRSTRLDKEKIPSDEVIELTSTSEDESARPVKRRKSATCRLLPTPVDVIELSDDDEGASCGPSSLKVLNRSGGSLQYTPAPGPPSPTQSLKREMTRKAKFADNIPSAGDALPVVEVHTSPTAKDARVPKLSTQAVGSLTQRLFSQSFLYYRNTQTMTSNSVGSHSSDGNETTEKPSTTPDALHSTESRVVSAANIKVSTDHQNLAPKQAHTEDSKVQALQTPYELMSPLAKLPAQPLVVRDFVNPFFDHGRPEPKAENERSAVSSYAFSTEIATKSSVARDDNRAATHEPKTNIEDSAESNPLTSPAELVPASSIVQDDNNYPSNSCVTAREPKTNIEDSVAKRSTFPTETSLTSPITQRETSSDLVIGHQPTTNIIDDSPEIKSASPIERPLTPPVVQDDYNSGRVTAHDSVTNLIEDYRENRPITRTESPPIAQNLDPDHVTTHEPTKNMADLPENDPTFRPGPSAELLELSTNKALTPEVETKYLSPQVQISDSSDSVAQPPPLRLLNSETSAENQVNEGAPLGPTSSTSSLMSSNDSSLPATPDSNNPGAFYVPSTTPNPKPDPDLFSKTLDPILPLVVPDTDDDDFLLSQGLTYPDFGTTA